MSERDGSPAKYGVTHPVAKNHYFSTVSNKQSAVNVCELSIYLRCQCTLILLVFALTWEHSLWFVLDVCVLTLGSCIAGWTRLHLCNFSPPVGMRSRLGPTVICVTVRLFLCLFAVRAHISKTTRPNFTKFSEHVAYDVDRSSSADSQISCVLPV